MRRKDWHIPSSPVALPSCNYTAPAANQRPPAYSPSPQRPHLGQRDLSPSPHPMTRHHLTSISPSSLPPSHHGLTSPIFPPPPHPQPSLTRCRPPSKRPPGRCIRPSLSRTPSVSAQFMQSSRPKHRDPRSGSVPVVPAWIQGLLGKLIRQPAVSPTYPPAPPRSRPVSGFLDARPPTWTYTTTAS